MASPSPHEPAMSARVQLDLLDTPALQRLERTVGAQLDQLKAQRLALDLTRGKPAADQLDLSNALDGILRGNYTTSDGADARNYGGLRGIPEARRLGAELLDTPFEYVLAGGNSSLQLMHIVVENALAYGLFGPGSAWATEATERHAPVKFLCLVPGYDRHFAINESLGIEMITSPLGKDGPNMAELERLVAADPMIKGVWCVPQYSNPTGITYSDDVVKAFARLPRAAGRHFIVMWDNAYAIHHLEFPARRIPSLLTLARDAGTADHVVMFASTSKITFAGAGVAFLAASERTLANIEKHLATATIGFDKVNQLRHARFLANRLDAQMRAHAELIRPKFATVLRHLESIAPLGIAEWTVPGGGYFISVDTRPGLAREVVRLAREAGVTLTPAGATYPRGLDPQNRNIRIAPTFVNVADVQAAMEVFTLCLQLASVRQILSSRSTTRP
jgi:DNA-binding transcriptional MocR family regulator